MALLKRASIICAWISTPGTIVALRAYRYRPAAVVPMRIIGLDLLS